MYIRNCIFIFFILTQALFANTGQVFELRGHLSKQRMTELTQDLEKIQNQEITLTLESTSGNLKEVLALSQKLYLMKAKKGVRIRVVLLNEVLGPAAVLPFVADEIFSSTFVTWGDIHFGNGEYPSNVLKSRVRALVSPLLQKSDLLKTLSEAMADPKIEIIEENGKWRVSNQAPAIRVGKIISIRGEALVLDHQQLKMLEVVKEWNPLPKKEKEKTVVEYDAKKDIKKEFLDFIRYSTDGETNRVGHLFIGGKDQGIGKDTWIYVKTALDYYKENLPIFIILELDTPGGEVFASQRISDALKEMDVKYKVPVVALINDWAISAGAMLAFSCRFVAVMPQASMGAAEPVFAGKEGMESAPEKINSAIRRDFANRARFYQRNPYLAEAMVDKDAIVVLRHGEVIKLDREEQIRISGPHKDKIISDKGKLLTLGADEMFEYGMADFMIPPGTVELISSLEQKTGKWPAKKSPLFLHSYFTQIPDVYIDHYKMSWQTQIFAFLAKPAVASLLFLGMMLGFYLEFNTPGFGLAGAAGLMCLSLIVLSSFALEAVHLVEIIMVVAGAVLLLVEALFLPGVGIAGALGALLFIGGIFALMLPSTGSVDFDFDTQTFNAAGQYFIDRLAYLMLSLIASIITGILLGRYVMPRFSGLQALVLSGEQDPSKGFVAGLSEGNLPKVGTAGEVMSTLRPAGKVLFGGVIYDAVSSGGLIDQGKRVRVVQIAGNRLVVDQIEELA